ncbi:chitobiase/beta-hexosaminidase C-terminal domain-containing protein [Gilliamella sp. HK7]|uniref:chitobiase/beta-hexosaminidase C-terminal domain-containing protein n=1 Tax=unclassified Gilliamella TaxID=2685620 RepID=UPI003FA60BB2
MVFPGLTIEYSTNQGKQWHRYNEPVNIKKGETVSVRSVSPNQKRTSRIEEVK